MLRRHFRRDLRSGRFIKKFALSAPAGLEHLNAIADPSLILILSDSAENSPGLPRWRTRSDRPWALDGLRSGC